MTFSIVIMVGRGYFLPTHVHEASKKDGTPMSAAREKQISCRLVRLNMTLLFTFVRSLGTEI